MDLDNEWGKLKILGYGLLLFGFAFFKSCETLQYKFAGVEAEAEVLGIVQRDSSGGISRRGFRAGGTSYHVDYGIELDGRYFEGTTPVSSDEFDQYPEGKMLTVLVLNADRPFPSTVIKGQETSIWFYILIAGTLFVLVVGGRIFLAAYRE